ncbi:hypothetical protein BYT27DRAFT_7191771, partial [Phlegmacium glaucopus]
ERKRIKGNAEDNVIDAQSSCRYELKNGLSVVGEFSWRVVLVTSFFTFAPVSLASYALILRSPHPTFLCLFGLFCKSSSRRSE